MDQPGVKHVSNQHPRSIFQPILPTDSHESRYISFEAKKRLGLYPKPLDMGIFCRKSLLARGVQERVASGAGTLGP